ncbi:MAG: hypothetical protein ACRETB_08635 [Steroidobacteraceae bacterium]
MTGLGREARVLLAGFCLVALFAATRLAFTLVHVSADPNEGWNAFHALIAMTGGPLYPPAGALTGNNYPPVSFYVVGWIGKRLGDFIVAGRLLSVASVLATAGLILVAVRRITHQNRTALWAALLFLLYDVTLFRSYFALNDPQWFAHVIEVAALVVLLPPNATGARSSGLPSTSAPPAGRIIVAALLFALAGFTKQNLVGIPCAVTLWLALLDRHRLAAWLVSGLVFVGLGFAAGYALYGAPVFQDVLLTPRSWSAERAIVKGVPVLLAMAPMIVATLCLSRRGSQDSRIRLIVLGAILCLLTGLFERSGDGVDINAHFETLIVLSIGSGVALATGLSRRRVLIWLLVPFIVLVPLAGAKAYRSLAREPQDLAGWNGMEARIRSVRGPVACENLAYCYWAGKGYEVDFFLDDQRMLAGRGGRRALDAALRTRSLQAAEMRQPTVASVGRASRVSSLSRVSGASRASSADPLSALFYADRSGVLYRSGREVLVSLR